MSFSDRGLRNRSTLYPANTVPGVPSVEDFRHMARRRFQNPSPFKRGGWWKLRYRQDVTADGQTKRINREIKLAPDDLPSREAHRLASEFLRPINDGLEGTGRASCFKTYVEQTYIPLVMPLLAKTTQDRYNGVIKNYLIPEFGDALLRELSPMRLQAYFSAMATSPLSQESRDKIRDVLAAILGSARRYGFIEGNPMEGIRLPPQRRGKRRIKPYLTPTQFTQLMGVLPEPYATMVFVAAFTGLRVSELLALRWEDIGTDCLTVDERNCRGDLGPPKTEASNSTIAINRAVIERLHRLKHLTVEVRAGYGTRKYKVVKSDAPDSFVFTPVRGGQYMRDNNILSRIIKPAARKLGLDFVNWLVLRRTHATWLKSAGADIKDAQAQMRHSRASTTLDIYQQFVPESQRRVVDNLSTLFVVQ